MFKNAEQVAAFVNLLEKFVGSTVHYTVFRDKGLDEAAKQTAAILNKDRRNLEMFIELASGITPATDTTDTMVCPDCGADMALRTNRTNGNKFWGCKKYPECRGTRDENGLSRAEREEAKYKKEQSVQEGGFSFNRDKRNPVTEVSPPEPITSTGWINPFAKK